jgi:hypothetical protein
MELIVNPSLKTAKSNLAVGFAVFIGAAAAAQALAARAGEREAILPRVEIASAIAQQGNEAVRRINREARDSARLMKPMALTELAGASTEVASK